MSMIFQSFDSMFFKMDIFIIMSIMIIMMIPYNFIVLSKIPFQKFFLTNLKIFFPNSTYFQKGLLKWSFNGVICIFILNFLSLFPFIFSPITHLVASFSISFMFWLGPTIFMQYSYFLTKKLKDTCPSGSPGWLMMFLVLLETISMNIRPFVLCIRIVANLSAGHLILALLTNISMYFSFLVSLPLFILEMFVCFIQSYVFFMLVTMYFIE